MSIKTSNITIDHLRNEKLVKDRILFIHGDITPELASQFSATMRVLINDLRKKISHETSYITLSINSNGGCVTSAFQMLHVIEEAKYLGIVIKTYNDGIAASAGALLLSSGTQGYRYMLPHSTTMLHSIQTGSNYQSWEDLVINMKHKTNIQDRIMKILADYSTQPNMTAKKMSKLFTRDTYFSFEEGQKKLQDIGLVDHLYTFLQKKTDVKIVKEKIAS